MAIWTQTYHLTPDEFASRSKELLNDGVSISGPSGTIEHGLPFGNHMTVNYAYDGSDSLTVELVRCTAFTNTVESKLNQWFTIGGH